MLYIPGTAAALNLCRAPFVFFRPAQRFFTAGHLIGREHVTRVGTFSHISVIDDIGMNFHFILELVT